MDLKSAEKPKIVTGLPGPKAKKLLEQRNDNLPVGVSQLTSTFIEKAQGAVVEDVDGNVFLDFAGGIGVMNIGHSNLEVVAAVKEQAEKYFHTCSMVVNYESYVKLAEKLNEITPGNFKKKTFFVNSGAEAVENAIKIARKYTGRTEIVAFNGAFHGRTLMTMTLTSKVKPYKFGFGPFAPGIHRMYFPYCYRCPLGLEKSNCNMQCVKLFDDFFIEEVAPEEIAAIILEPILGESGFIVPPDEYIIQLRSICDKYGIVLIADEVQTGFCRTGKMFASQYWSVCPDIITTAKSMGSGLPIAGITGKAEIMDATHSGGLGGTFGGNPLACVAGLKVIEVMQRDNFSDKANSIGKICMDRLNAMKEKYQIIGDVRGRGAMIAMELVKDRRTKEPAKEETTKIINECWKNGLLLLSAGTRGNTIRFLMPLVVTEKQLTNGLEILERAIKTVVQV
jgi:4-aminobutyrate aminotransferase/(S)-3-amino-2-methylpropionate transaminase